MTLLKDNNYKEINIALLSLEADIKKLSKNTNFNTDDFDAQLADINKRIDEINGVDETVVKNLKNDVIAINSDIDNIENDISTINTNIDNIEQKLSNIFTAENKVTDFNTTTDSGIYYWIDDAANRPSDYGVLLVNKFDSGSGSLWINQIAYGTNNKIYFRQNINSGNWTGWKTIAFDGEVTANKVANVLTVNGKTYDGSSAVNAGVQKIENGGTGATTALGAFESLANGLPEGAGPEDTEHIIFQNSNRKNWGLYTLSHFWEYIKSKISSVLGLTKDTYGGKAASAGSADTVDNYHASQLWRSDGANWNPNANVTMTPSGNNSEWSFDFRNKNGATGTYWQVWDENKNTLLKVDADSGKVSAPYGFVGNLTGKADTAGTADYSKRLKTFASWNNQYDWDSTNGVRLNVYKITMTSAFNSILVQIYDDINYARCRRYILGLWHVNNYGYNVSVTDLGGSKYDGLRVWMGTDGNVYLQADVYWTSRISFSYLDDITDVTITKIGNAKYGYNKDVDGTVLFTPLTDPIVDCGAIRAEQNLSSAQKVSQRLNTDILYASNVLYAQNKMIIPIGEPSSLENGCIWIS